LGRGSERWQLIVLSAYRDPPVYVLPPPGLILQQFHQLVPEKLITDSKLGR